MGLPMGPRGEGVEMIRDFLHAEPEEVLIARTYREAHARIIAKMASQQLSEVWHDTPTVGSLDPDRRARRVRRQSRERRKVTTNE